MGHLIYSAPAKTRSTFRTGRGQSFGAGRRTLCKRRASRCVWIEKHISTALDFAPAQRTAAAFEELKLEAIDYQLLPVRMFPRHQHLLVEILIEGDGEGTAGNFGFVRVEHPELLEPATTRCHNKSQSNAGRVSVA